MQRLQPALATIQLPAAGADGGGDVRVVTASVGVAIWRHGANDDAVLVQADQALYCAKQRGRNRLVLAERSGHNSIAIA